MENAVKRPLKGLKMEFAPKKVALNRDLILSIFLNPQARVE